MEKNMYFKRKKLMISIISIVILVITTVFILYNNVDTVVIEPNENVFSNENNYTIVLNMSDKPINITIDVYDIQYHTLINDDHSGFTTSFPVNDSFIGKKIKLFFNKTIITPAYDYEFIDFNETIKNAYDQYLHWVLCAFQKNNRFLPSVTIDLPVLDEYGRHVHYEKTFYVTISNEYNISTCLHTGIQYYDEKCETHLEIYKPDSYISEFGHLYKNSGAIPDELDNQYFDIRFGNIVDIDPFDKKDIAITIEIYGSGVDNQVFYHKSYPIRFVLFDDYFNRDIFTIFVNFTDGS